MDPKLQSATLTCVLFTVSVVEHKSASEAVSISKDVLCGL